MKLSIIVPVFNEEKTLEEMIKRVQKINLGKVSKEFIIVNDGSIDQTEKVISILKKKFRNIKSVSHKVNKGKGAAIRSAIEHISGEITTIQDADLEYNPHDFASMIKFILDKKTQVVYGSRLINRPDGYWIFTHYYGNKFLSLLTKILYGKKITDMETCYKMMPTKILKELKLRSSRFEIEPEITAKIMKKGYKMIEIPIKYSGRSFKEGKKINWVDGLQAVWTLIYWKFKKY